MKNYNSYEAFYVTYSAIGAVVMELLPGAFHDIMFSDKDTVAVKLWADQLPACKLFTIDIAGFATASVYAVVQYIATAVRERIVNALARARAEHVSYCEVEL